MEQTRETINEMVNAKVLELKSSKGGNIIPFVGLLNDEYIVGYATEPTREMKAFALAKSAKSPLIAGMELLKWCAIPEVTDVRFFSEDNRYDSLVYMAGMKLMNTIEILEDQCIAINI